MPVPRHAPWRLPLTFARSSLARRWVAALPGPQRILVAAVALALVTLPLPATHSVSADPLGTYAAKLTGGHEVPVVATTGTATARVILSDGSLFYQVLLTGLGQVSGVDLASAAIGSSGPVLISLPVNADGSISGHITAADHPPVLVEAWSTIVASISSGTAYLNVRTAAVPGGELRGQLALVSEPAVYTVTAGAPPAGSPAIDDIFPRSLTVAQPSVVRFVVTGQHTATLLPAGMTALGDRASATLSANAPAGCGDDANPCYFDGSAPLSIGPAPDGASLTVTVRIGAPMGSYVIHSRLQPAMEGLLTIAPPGAFEISSVDDIAIEIASQLGSVPPTRTATSVYSGLLGYDVSYPDCKHLDELPAVDPLGFAVVGANGGRMFRYNACLSTLWNWAGQFALRSLYVNTNAAAGPTMQQGATGPAGTCRKKDLVCYGYNYGYKAARAAWRYAYHQLGPENLPQIWWLDVEVSNVWYTAPDKNANAAVVRGALDFLGKPGRYGAPSMNYTVGIYSTMFQFQRIVGSGFKPGVPVWYATIEKSHPPSLTRCAAPRAKEWSFTGGPVWLVQYLPGGTDHNVGCP